MALNMVGTVKKRNLPFRLMVFLMILIPIIFLKDFYQHIYSHFTGTILTSVITHQWHIVLINILIFISFLIPLSFRRKIDWKEYGLVTAFFVSLFVEMYGLPLTILLASKSIDGPVVGLADVIYEFEFLGVNIAMDLAMFYASILIVIGTIFIIAGWYTLYKNIKKVDLVTTGLYSYSRHPQYFGFILIIIGWLVGWPTILTTIFALILIYKYIRVCKVEEKELAHIEEYQNYKNNVPFLI